MADPLSPSLPTIRNDIGICETEAAVLAACSSEVLRHGLYAAVYGGEVLIYGASRADTILAARKILNADNPAGEPRWTLAEAARLVTKLRPATAGSRRP